MNPINVVTRFAEAVSINEGIDLLSDGLVNVFGHGDRHTVTIKTGSKYYKLIVGTIITYRIDKNTLRVYDFNKRFLGDIISMIQHIEESIRNAPDKYKSQVTPKIVWFRKSPVPYNGYTGKIFTTSWGYDQTNNEFVKVVSETNKQVKVVKLKTRKHENGFMSGREYPVNEPVSRPFILVKDVYDGEIILRGADKSGSGTRDSTTIWRLYKGDGEQYSSYA